MFIYLRVCRDGPPPCESIFVVIKHVTISSLRLCLSSAAGGYLEISPSSRPAMATMEFRGIPPQLRGSGPAESATICSWFESRYPRISKTTGHDAGVFSLLSRVDVRSTIARAAAPFACLTSFMPVNADC